MIMMGKRKHALSQILGPEDEETKEGGGDSALHSCVQELIDAVHSKDVEGAAQALKSCFMELESEPHDEYPHEGE